MDMTTVAVAIGAALAGCCAQMVGFAVMSFRENRWGGLVSQGLGTSMLQMGNILKNPLVCGKVERQKCLEFFQLYRSLKREILKRRDCTLY